MHCWPSSTSSATALLRGRVGVLEMGDTILDSLIAAIAILEPLKELKETIKNKVEYGADGEIIRLDIYPYRERS